eukprot:131687_1
MGTRYSDVQSWDSSIKPDSPWNLGALNLYNNAPSRTKNNTFLLTLLIIGSFIRCTNAWQGVNCYGDTWCYDKGVWPTENTTTWTRWIEHDCCEQQFRITFKIWDYECIRPTLSFRYERIDYDEPDKYIKIFDSDDTEIVTCGAGEVGNLCGSEHECLTEYDLGLDHIRRDMQYDVYLYVSGMVRFGCLPSLLSISAYLTLSCHEGTISPTTEPTFLPTINPTFATHPPSIPPTMEPTEATLFPTVNPTVATLHPSASPSHVPTNPTFTPTISPTLRISCGQNEWCYAVDIFPNISSDTTWTVPIENGHVRATSNYIVTYDVIGFDCVYPSVSFWFERLDYASEYINIYDNDDTLLDTCTKSMMCSPTSICMNNHYLSTDIIRVKEQYQIRIYELSTMKAQCSHTSTMKARLDLSCFGGSLPPTLEPTPDPTLEPTRPSSTPTSAPTNAPTITPTGATSAPTESTTLPTMTPTKQPTYVPTVRTLVPSNTPSVHPSASPTVPPSSSPSFTPTSTPTTPPTTAPSSTPTQTTNSPSHSPTSAPSTAPSTAPSLSPSNQPTTSPSHTPSSPPSSATVYPTNAPSMLPSTAPSDSPLVFSTILVEDSNESGKGKESSLGETIGWWILGIVLIIIFIGAVCWSWYVCCFGSALVIASAAS